MTAPQHRTVLSPGRQQAVPGQGGHHRLGGVEIPSVEKPPAGEEAGHTHRGDQGPQETPSDPQLRPLKAVGAVGHPGVDLAGEGVDLGGPAHLQSAAGQAPDGEPAIAFPSLQGARRNAGIGGNLLPAVQTPPPIVGHASHDGRSSLPPTSRGRSSAGRSPISVEGLCAASERPSKGGRHLLSRGDPKIKDDHRVGGADKRHIQPGLVRLRHVAASHAIF